MKSTFSEKVRAAMVMTNCLVAFFFMGLQNSFAQNYVDNATAQTRLETELQSIGDVYYVWQGNPAAYTHQYQGLQIFVYKKVHKDIVGGSNVADAIRNNWIGGQQGSAMQGLRFFEHPIPVSSLRDADANQIMNELITLLSN